MKSFNADITATVKPPKIDFYCGNHESTTVDSSTFSVGHYKNKTAAPAVYKTQFLMHSQDPYRPTSDPSSANNDLKGGLSTTTFGRGFQRRLESSISNPIKDLKNEYASEKSERSLIASKSRTETLLRVD